MAGEMERAVRILDGASNLCVFTGAGMSKDSGIETFRGPGGIWERFSSDDLATVEGFLRDPELVWEWYETRRRQVRDLEPHAGYVALAQLEGMFERTVVVTQNIDGLHRRSGAANVVELHGNIWMVRCAAEDNEPWLDERVPLPEIPPVCECGGFLRPHVVWFGEPLDRRDILAATVAAQDCDAMLVVGTSAIVYPAAGFPQQAKHHGAAVIEVNIEPTPVTDYADVSLFGRAEEVLPELVEGLGRARDGA